MSSLADLRPQGGEPPCYIYKARRGGLGGFSRLRNRSRGVYPTAGIITNGTMPLQLNHLTPYTFAHDTQ